MKKQILCVMVFVFCGLMFAQEDTKSLAVATFDISEDAVSESEADIITDLFISEMVSTGWVTITDRSSFEKIMAEMNFQDTDWSNKEKTVELGNASNADMICRGQISKIENNYHLIATIIDSEDASVLSFVQDSFTNIDEIDGILERFCAKLAKGGDDPTKIGTRGPGGGLIFYIEGNTYYECSDNLGEANWEDAKTMAENYRGGEYDDWYLPTKEELNYIYDNLREEGLITNNESFWSSSEASNSNAWVQSFANGTQYYHFKPYKYNVRAIRAFNYLTL